MTPSLSVSFKSYPEKPKGTLVLMIGEDRALKAPVAEGLDAHLSGLLQHALKISPAFTGKVGEALTLPIPKGHGIDRVVLLGAGKAKTLNAFDLESMGAKLAGNLRAHKIEAAGIVFEADTYGKLEQAHAAAHLAVGAALGGYDFIKYKTAQKKEKIKTDLTLYVHKPADAKKAHARLEAMVEATLFARDLVNEAPNVLYPDSYAKLIAKTLKPLGVKVTILDEKQMAKLGMGAALAVAQGSEKPARIVALEWQGKKQSAKEKPVGFVGKGVTFDTGGICIKPAPGMEDMKMDMAGSAAVVGLFMALAKRKAKVHAVGVVGLVENMPSDRAYRPADIITAMNGKTIEVLNTDAEGRLVLADALCYIQKKYNPKAIVDLATLTGAIIVALGHEYCGSFVNDDALWQQLHAASLDTGEKLWRMPLDDTFAKQMEGTVTDVKNMGNGRDAGSSLGAHFIEKFLDPKVPWAHLDIAGTAWIKSGKPTVPKGATGFGVRLLDHFVETQFEK